MLLFLPVYKADNDVEKLANVENRIQYIGIILLQVHRAWLRVTLCFQKYRKESKESECPLYKRENDPGTINSQANLPVKYFPDDNETKD